MQKNSSNLEDFQAHVDKANVASYDFSAVLYFSTSGLHFQGAEA